MSSFRDKQAANYIAEIAWETAYDKAIADGKSEDEAWVAADRAQEAAYFDARGRQRERVALPTTDEVVASTLKALAK